MRGSMEMSLVLDALTMAVWRRRPKGSVIIHSDQGSQFGSDDFCRWCKENRLSPSMSRRGNCWDNAVVESIFSSLKSEKIKRKIYKTRQEARLRALITLKASTIQFGVTIILTNSALLSSRDVKLRYEQCLQNWGNAFLTSPQSSGSAESFVQTLKREYAKLANRPYLNTLTQTKRLLR